MKYLLISTNLVLSLLFELMAYSSYSQITFQRTFGGSSNEFCSAIHQTSDNGYVEVGYTTSFGAGLYDVYVVKTDASGNLLWTKTIGGASDDYGNDIQQTNDGGYIIVGRSNSFGAGNTDIYLIRLNAVGDIVWTKTYGGINIDRGYSVRQTIDGGYIISGGTRSFGAGKDDIYLIKIDDSGQLAWSKTFGLSGYYYGSGNNVIQTPDGGYIIAAYYAGDYFLIKTNSNGILTWSKDYSGAYYYGSFIQTNDGGYAILGTTTSFGVVQQDVYLIKTDSFGNLLWSKTYGGNLYEQGASFLQTSDGGYLLAGSSTNASDDNVYLIRINSNGNPLWTKLIGSSPWSQENCHSIQKTSDGGYILGGSKGNYPITHIYIIKTDADGNSGCNQTITTTTTTAPATIVSSPTLVSTSPITITSSAASNVGNGGIEITYCEYIPFTYISPYLFLNTSSINIGQNITITGSHFRANGKAKITFRGPAGFSQVITVPISNAGAFTKIYTTSTSMPVGNYTVSAKDSISGLTTTFKSFTLKAVGSASYLQLLLDPGTTFHVSANGDLMFEFKDKMVTGSSYPIVGSERLYSYNIELSADGGNTWTPLGNLSNQELINHWVLLPYFVTITTPGTNYKIKITDTYKPSNFVISPIFSASPTIITGNLKVQFKWDFSYPNPGVPINGICADGTARIYLDLSKINSSIGSPISHVSVALDDGGVNTGKDKLGKVKVATNTASYSSEANGISSLTATNNTTNLSDYYFWYVAPDDFVGNDPADESSSNRRVTATFTVTYSDGTIETISKPIIIVRPPLMLVHGLGGDPSTWDNFRENLFGTTWNFINDFKFKTAVPVRIDPSASFAVNAFNLTRGNSNDLNNSMPGVISQMRQKGYASVKVDYIGHSMGGSVLRYALDHYNNVYKRTGTSANLPYKNYETGYINKAITIGTPHKGSPLANIINRYIGGLPTWASLTLESWYGFADKPFPFYFIKPTDPSAWIWDYEPTNAVMDLRVNGGITFNSSNIKAHLIAGDIFPGEQANLPSGLIPQDIIDAVHNSPGNYIEQFVNYLFQVAKINETDPVLHQAVLNAISNIEPVDDALSFLEYLTLAMDAFNYGTFVPESDLVVGVGSQLAGFSGNDPNVTVIDDFVAHSSPMPNRETNNLQIGNTVMQLLNDPISSDKFAGFPNNSSKYVSPQLQPLTLSNPYFSVRDTNKLKLLQPADSLSFAVDTNINVRVKLLDTLGLKTLNVYFQGKTYPINDFSTSDIILNLQINSNELNWCKLVAEGYYNYSDSAKLVYDERTLNILPNDSLIGFTADPDLIQLAINQVSFADYTAVYAHFNTPVLTNDPNLAIAINDTNIVAIEYTTRGFKGKQQGQTFAVVTYTGISDTIYFNVTGCTGGVVNILSATTSICSGDALSLTADNGIHFEWSTGDTTQTIVISTVGNYSVFAIDSNGCLATASINITNSDTCNNLEGTVTYNNGVQSKMTNTLISIKQGQTLYSQTSTDANGYYLFQNLPIGTFTLNASCTKPWGGVNAIDGLLILKHFTGLTPLIGIKLKAADVDGSGYINSTDALVIVKRFVGLTNSFSVGDWFFEKDTIIINGTNNVTSNLKALCFGDIDGSFIPEAKVEPSLILSNSGSIFTAEGDEVEFPITISESAEIGAISIILNIPRECLKIEDITSRFNGNLVYNVIGDELRIAWYSTEPMDIQAREALLTVRCRIISQVNSTCNNWMINPESQIADGNGILITGLAMNIPELVVKGNDFYLGQNVPNPFSGNCEISYYLPEQGTVLLKVYDMLGNEIRTLVNQTQQSGSYTTHFQVDNIPAGVYSYKLEVHGTTRYFNKTKQMVIGD